MPLKADWSRGKEVPEFDGSLICYCRHLLHSEPIAIEFIYMPRNRFARHYCLPCRHVFRLDMESKVLIPVLGQSFIHMFDELGMAVYETIGRVAIEDGEQEAMDVLMQYWMFGSLKNSCGS